MQFTDLKAQYAALKPDIDARIQRVLEHGQYILGPEVKELEERLAAFVGVRHCIGVASGTEALLIALMSLGLGRGDEVITTPFSFAATAETIVLAGATPVFVDVEPDTCLIDATQIEARITPRTRALVPVSLYGQVADMDALNAIAARHGLAVIEDPISLSSYQHLRVAVGRLSSSTLHHLRRRQRQAPLKTSARSSVVQRPSVYSQTTRCTP